MKDLTNLYLVMLKIVKEHLLKTAYYSRDAVRWLVQLHSFGTNVYTNPKLENTHTEWTLVQRYRVLNFILSFPYYLTLKYFNKILCSGLTQSKKFKRFGRLTAQQNFKSGSTDFIEFFFFYLKEYSFRKFFQSALLNSRQCRKHGTPRMFLFCC